MDLNAGRSDDVDHGDDDRGGRAVIRPLGPADAASLAVLARETYVAAFGHSYEPGDLAAHLASHLADAAIARALREDVVLGAEVRGQLVGFAQAGGDRDVELRRLYVLADWQGRGIGSALLRTLLRHGQVIGRRVTLDVWERNGRARLLYERFGFREIGRRRMVMASGKAGDEDVLMAREAACGDGLGGQQLGVQERMGPNDAQ